MISLLLLTTTDTEYKFEYSRNVYNKWNIWNSNINMRINNNNMEECWGRENIKIFTRNKDYSNMFYHEREYFQIL